MAKIESNDVSRLQCLEKLTFSPDAKGKIIFNFVLVIAAFFNTHQATYIACFGFPTSFEMDLAGKIIECIFILDIILNFFMQYIDESGDYKPQKNIRKIAIRYLLRDFLIDFISTIPFWIYFIPVTDDVQVLELL